MINIWGHFPNFSHISAIFIEVALHSQMYENIEHCQEILPYWFISGLMPLAHD
jgi:hypothetical protein